MVAALAAAWWTGSVASAYLVNVYGPMSDAVTWAPVVVVAATLLVAVAALLTVRWVARRAAVLGACCAVAVVAAAWVLAPVVVDEGESFVEVPDRTATCTGWSFEHYPPQTSDADSLEYCVGVEHPVDR